MKTAEIMKKVKENWIMFIIVLQPLIDIISYFQTENTGTSYTWAIRIAFLFTVFIMTYIYTEKKGKTLLKLLPFVVFYFLHIINLYRIGTLDLIEETKYYIQVFQLPILAILLIDYIKATKYDLDKIKRGILYSSIIIVVSILLAYVTKTYQYTYIAIQKGITGWFSSANTISMILCAVCPWAIYMLSNQKRLWMFIVGTIIMSVILFTNATRACFYTLVATLFVFACIIALSKGENRKIKKIIILISLLILVIILYKNSFTSSRLAEQMAIEQENSKLTEEILKESSKNGEETDISKLYERLEEPEIMVKVLRTNYLYSNLIDIHGEKKVTNVVKPYIKEMNLSDNRLMKVINSKIEFEYSDVITQILGIGYSKVFVNSLDMENDLQAIFYYYGYLGMLIYAVSILQYIIKALIAFYKNKYLINNKEFLILLFMIFLLIAGGEYSGAFLRKSNANIYLSLYFVLLYFNIINNCKKRNRQKKITFLLLHLGYGGIETSTINTANALSEKYNVELISFYNLKKNQEKHINKEISVKHLYKGEPNKEEFLSALKKKNIIKIIKEGFKSIFILINKKLLVIKAIVECDSSVIVSTRYDFSMLLSKFGAKDVTKIAQEHHHHNNNSKYIKILKDKYKNINYLFALTSNLKKDYEIFLKNNKYTQIIVVPNMLDDENRSLSDLSHTGIISVSRLNSGKRIKELIDIFSKLEDKKSKLYIIGDGTEKENLNRQIEDLNLQENVFMTGYLDKYQQEKFWKKSSVYAMTSISEGLPMVLLEAMAHGIPCIAYKTDAGVADIIENNKNGFIIENRHEQDYINKLNNLILDEQLRKNMQIECLKTAQKYSKTEVVKKWLKILQQVL